MKIKPKTQYRIAEENKTLFVTNVEELPEATQLVEGELFDLFNNFLAPYIGVVADGVDVITGLRFIRQEDKNDISGRPERKVVRVRKNRKD